MISEGGPQNERYQLAQEVLELGEELFDLALEQQSKSMGNTKARAEVEELREAKEEFFVALRILLGRDTRSTKP